MSILKANKIQTVSGQTYQNLIQVRQYSYNLVYENTSQNVEYDMPGDLGNGNAVITPVFANSLVWFKALIHCGQEDTWRSNFFKVYYRINGGTWNFLNNAGFSHTSYVSGSNGMMQSTPASYLFSFNTTGTIGFKITQTGHANGGYLHLNQNNTTNNTAANNTVGCSSTITLMEIAQ